ncbi:hypothetical protein [Haloquadratum walsbyi]|uniref:Uncharacterized protein n=1 Tax=Haloquadratum walsbyi (strain DSM 16854 / JCM 12705 / C23) TaxID=768065 RepID=G0LNG4_HALWC|nr:hypothetical protein [Haloquadratum walsbyi]CCC41970.1 conserved hypothetical protein [Haloquadratum walsbyi C23]
MSGTKDDADSTSLSLTDDDNVVQKKRIKEILNLRHGYITARHEIRSSVRTGNLSNADGAELLKSRLDSFLLDIRPIILRSEHASLWTTDHIGTIELQQRRTTMGGRGGPEVMVQGDEIDINGLGQLLKINATFDRKWRRVQKNHGRFSDRVGEVVDQDGLQHPTAVIDSRIFDEAFTKANDVLADLGLDVGLNENDDEAVDFDYSDLI